MLCQVGRETAAGYITHPTAAADAGIYYLDATMKPGIAHFDSTTHRTTRVFDLENPSAKEAPSASGARECSVLMGQFWNCTSTEIGFGQFRGSTCTKC